MGAAQYTMQQTGSVCDCEQQVPVQGIVQA